LTEPRSARFRKGFAACAAAGALLFLAAPALAQATFESVFEEGQLALDTGRYTQAADLFERAAAMEPGRLDEIAPDRAWAYVRLANHSLSRRGFKEAERYFTLAAAIYPKFREVFLPEWQYVRLYELNQKLEEGMRYPRATDWRQLEDEARWVVDADPRDVQAHFALGVIYEAERKREKAKTEYLTVLGARAPQGNRSTEVLRQAAQKALPNKEYVFDLKPVYPPWREVDPGPFQTLRRAPFVIYHHNRGLAARVAAVIEYDLGLPVLGGVLPAKGPLPEQVNVYVFANNEEFSKYASQEKWAGAESTFTLLDDKIVAASMRFFQTSTGLTESAVPHELAHVRLVASAHFYEGLPLWVQEGVATSTESSDKKGAARETLARARDNGTLISFTELVAATSYPSGAVSDLYYGESLAAVEMLVSRYGKDKFWDFVSGLKDGDQVETLKRVYRLTPVQVEDLVIEWIAGRQ